MSSPILVTKLFIPTARPEIVPRPRLVERLDGGLHRKLTLISAPAGFGKTTLVTEWLDRLMGDSKQGNQIETRFSWLSLDEGDNDLVRFLTYFIAALDQIEEIDATGIMSMLQSPQPAPTEALLTPLINQIAAVSGRILFVLDDFHLVEAQSVQDTISFILENIPPQLHLVITTREDPLLPLSRLRARGQLTELRAADLRFTSAEAAEFLNQVMGLNLSTEDIAELETRTEGWIAGLQLAAISLQGQVDTAKQIHSFSGSNRLVIDYLIEEVLNQQPENIQTFLLQTAILERLNGSLCNAVTKQEDGQQTLEYLEKNNLFVIHLDHERQWYRYHHLFADLLRQWLQRTHPEQIPTLHQRASEWYEKKDQTPDAIHHALAAEDLERVADLAELAWPKWSDNLQSIAWLGWVDKLPEELVRERPVLCVAYAQALLNAGRLEIAEARLLDAERRLASTTEMSDQPKASPIKMIVVDETQFKVLPTWLATTRAYHAQAIGDAHSTVKYAQQALDLFPDNDYYNRAAVTGLLGLASWTSGDLEAAYRTFSDSMFQTIHDRIKGTFVLADMQMTLGHLNEAEKTCEQSLKLAQAYDPPMPVGTEDVFSKISEIHREQGNLETAAQDLNTAQKLGEQVELPDWQHRYCIAKARLKETLGDLDGALDLLDEAERLFVRTPVPIVRPIAALNARVWTRQGRLDKALAWARERDLSADDDLNYLREFEHITLTRVLIVQYKRDQVDESIHMANELLERLLQAAEEMGRMGSVLNILVLQALAYEAQDNIPHALMALERALKQAEPEGYFRIFVDEGPSMARLLYEALSQGITPEYVRRLLAAFPIDEPEQNKSPQSQIQEAEWIEPLSERELEVLRLIAEGMSNPEIAAQLYLALNTVKAHTRTIYSKLEVNNRTQAVARARAFGILTPT